MNNETGYNETWSACFEEAEQLVKTMSLAEQIEIAQHHGISPLEESFEDLLVEVLALELYEG